jgi:hypothetical protein
MKGDIYGAFAFVLTYDLLNLRKQFSANRRFAEEAGIILRTPRGKTRHFRSRAFAENFLKQPFLFSTTT